MRLCPSVPPSVRPIDTCEFASAYSWTRITRYSYCSYSNVCWGGKSIRLENGGYIKISEEDAITSLSGLSFCLIAPQRRSRQYLLCHCPLRQFPISHCHWRHHFRRLCPLLHFSNAIIVHALIHYPNTSVVSSFTRLSFSPLSYTPFSFTPSSSTHCYWCKLNSCHRHWHHCPSHHRPPRQHSSRLCCHCCCHPQRRTSL